MLVQTMQVLAERVTNYIHKLITLLYDLFFEILPLGCLLTNVLSPYFAIDWGLTDMLTIQKHKQFVMGCQESV